jgi:hypothetical protein
MLSCPGNTMNCSGSCRDLTDDPANCGACGMKCPSGNNSTPVCLASSCSILCAAATADCNRMAGDGCEVDLTSDVNNCGLCAVKCAGVPNAVPTCKSAMCGFTCNMGFNDCNGVVVDGCESNPLTDAKNCSRCGAVCPGGANATPACAMGACAIACNMNYGDCNKMAGDGCEVNLQTDNNNCGKCGTVCGGATPVCIAGKCGSTHSTAMLTPDFNTNNWSGCGDNSNYWTQDMGQMTYDDCETAANKYGAQFMGQTGYFGSYSAPYQNTVRWVGEADANNGWASTPSWNNASLTPRGTKLECVLAYANGSTPGNGTFNTSWQSANGKTYLVNDYGSISEKTCYSNALAAGARPLNPWMFAAATKTAAHMIESHQSHGSLQYNGLGTFQTDGSCYHTYRCLVGYNQ